jgi:hypothetical protein
MAYLTPEAKSEEAFRLYFESVRSPDLDGVQFLKRFDVDIKAAPFITIVAESADPMFTTSPQITGNFRVGMVFRVVSHSLDHTGEEHDAYVGTIADQLFLDNVATTLNSLMSGESFTAFLWTPTGRTNDVDGNTQTTEIRGNLLMMPFAT